MNGVVNGLPMLRASHTHQGRSGLLVVFSVSAFFRSTGDFDAQ